MEVFGNNSSVLEHLYNLDIYGKNTTHLYNSDIHIIFLTLYGEQLPELNEQLRLL